MRLHTFRPDRLSLDTIIMFTQRLSTIVIRVTFYAVNRRSSATITVNGAETRHSASTSTVDRCSPFRMDRSGTFRTQRSLDRKHCTHARVRIALAAQRNECAWTRASGAMRALSVKRFDAPNRCWHRTAFYR